MRGIVIFSSRYSNRSGHHACLRNRLSATVTVFFSMLLLASFTGCDRDQAPAVEPVQKRSAEEARLVRFPVDEVARSGVTVEPVGRTSFSTYRTFPGVVRPNENALANITTLVRGRVAEVHADLGQMVKAKQLLAVLHSGDLGLAQSAYLKARARRHVAEQAYQRAQFLYKEKVIGQAEAQRREGEMISIRAEAQEALEGLRLLGMDDKEIRSLERTQTIRSQVPIVAPFAGRVIARDLTKGELVETTHKLFAVADLSTVWVVANVSEKDVSYVQRATAVPNQSVEVYVAAYPDDIFKGTVSYVGDILDTATRTMQVRLTLENPIGRLKPEMFATIRISSEPVSDVLVVPEAAVQNDQSRSFVFVQQEAGIFEARTIRLGDKNGTFAEVLDGLREGEKVVKEGAFILKSELLKPKD
ncbi:MAG TPA: efflux RND transporter periplasmic adaptor subunit [Nitrospiraceae bacterium]|nr:efflux RND transporter periplasmic adaptor subunit [Nitrospiraceae bacterium]